MERLKYFALYEASCSFNMTAYGQSFLIDRSYYNWPSARFWSEMVQCFGGFSSFFHISNFFSFEPPIKRLVVLIKLVNCRSFNDPVLLVIMSSHSMICCWTMSHHGIFISQSFDSNLSRDRICTTSMALNDLTWNFMGFSLFWLMWQQEKYWQQIKNCGSYL